MCFLWVWGELDGGQTSHSTTSSIVLQTAPASPAKRQPEETFLFSLFSSMWRFISQRYSVLLLFGTIAPFLPRTAMPVFATSPVFLCLLLEDTCWKAKPLTMAIPHTISLAFIALEYRQLCWKLNSQKPPSRCSGALWASGVCGAFFRPSRGWCQRAPIVPRSTAVLTSIFS